MIGGELEYNEREIIKAEQSPRRRDNCLRGAWKRMRQSDYQNHARTYTSVIADGQRHGARTKSDQKPCPIQPIHNVAATEHSTTMLMRTCARVSTPPEVAMGDMAAVVVGVGMPMDTVVLVMVRLEADPVPVAMETPELMTPVAVMGMLEVGVATAALKAGEYAAHVASGASGQSSCRKAHQ